MDYWRDPPNTTTNENDLSIHYNHILIITRTIDNWLRFFLQAVVAHERGSSTTTTPQSILQHWSHPPELLELYVLLMEQQAPPLRRHVSQILFYATFAIPVPHFESCLLEQHQWGPRLLVLLVHQGEKDDLRTCLSLVRNVHSILAGYNGKRYIEASAAVVSGAASSWLSVPEGSSVSYALALRDLALYAAATGDHDNHSDNKYNDMNDQVRNDLLLEILRCFYVLKVPDDIATDSQWHSLLRDLVGSKDDDNDDDDDDPITTLQSSLELRTAVASILMDAPVALSSHVPPRALLELLRESIAAHPNIVDDRAAAALTPVLMVLYKYCSAFPSSYCQQVHDRLFPPDTPHTTTTPRVDAPPGTLRHAILSLLTHPQGHVKRWAGEWLWVVCGGDATVFTRRVGWGNAVPILQVKGQVALPTMTAETDETTNGEGG